jgi:hypothetical protein
MSVNATGPLGRIEFTGIVWMYDAKETLMYWKNKWGRMQYVREFVTIGEELVDLAVDRTKFGGWPTRDGAAPQEDC